MSDVLKSGTTKVARTSIDSSAKPQREKGVVEPSERGAALKEKRKKITKGSSPEPAPKLGRKMEVTAEYTKPTGFFSCLVGISVAMKASVAAVIHFVFIRIGEEFEPLVHRSSSRFAVDQTIFNEQAMKKVTLTHEYPRIQEKYRLESAELLMNPMDNNTLSSLLYQARGACLRPYKALCSLQTLHFLFHGRNPFWSIDNIKEGVGFCIYGLWHRNDRVTDSSL
ncbi:hypothetical protein R1flu_008757 [Riccia fluitans]|uniref:Uncharacterized protein n=1 Tax=Riccia fluitans TaxID=41844 RepID=A0ABD1YG71_9MARC